MDGNIFMGEVDPSRHHVKILIWQFVRGLNWIEWLKMEQGNVYISCNYSCTIPFLVKTLLVKLEYLYIQYA